MVSSPTLGQLPCTKHIVFQWRVPLHLVPDTLYQTDRFSMASSPTLGPRYLVSNRSFFNGGYPYTWSQILCIKQIVFQWRVPLHLAPVTLYQTDRFSMASTPTHGPRYLVSNRSFSMGSTPTPGPSNLVPNRSFFSGECPYTWPSYLVTNRSFFNGEFPYTWPVTLYQTYRFSMASTPTLGPRYLVSNRSFFNGE